MKTLFIILKVTTGITLIAPTTLSVTQYFQTYGAKDPDQTVDKTVNTSTADPDSPLNSVLEGHSGITQDENFSNFTNNKMSKEKYPTTQINNDNNSETTGSDASDGLADDRFGGGLFFDIGGGTDGFNKQTQNKINKIYPNGIFGSTNFMSINHQMSPDSGVNGNESDTISQQTLDQNNMQDDTYATTQRDNVQNSRHLPPTEKSPTDYEDTSQKINHSFNNATDNSSWNDSIVNEKDFDLTPGNLTTPTGKQNYKTKETMRTLFNEELYDWYWTTWNREYDDPSVANANYATANVQQQALDQSGLMNDIKLGLNLSWNQLITVEQDTPWWAKAAKEIALGVLGTLLDEPLKGLGGILSGFLGFLLPDANNAVDKTIWKLYNYYSAAFGYSFWSDFFNKYLGTPDGTSGLINDYYKTHGKIPSDITLNNFDFYTPFSNININSQFIWEIVHYYEGGPGHDVKRDSSTSKFDLSNLTKNLNLGVDFNLTRNDPTIDQLLTKLQNEYNYNNPLKIPQSEFIRDTSGSYKGKYYVDDTTSQQGIHHHNEGMIKEYLDDHGFNQLDRGLTLEGELIPGQASKLVATYNNGRNVPIFVDIS